MKSSASLFSELGSESKAGDVKLQGRGGAKAARATPGKGFDAAFKDALGKPAGAPPGKDLTPGKPPAAAAPEKLPPEFTGWTGVDPRPPDRAKPEPRKSAPAQPAEAAPKSAAPPPVARVAGAAIPKPLVEESASPQPSRAKAPAAEDATVPAEAAKPKRAEKAAAPAEKKVRAHGDDALLPLLAAAPRPHPPAAVAKAPESHGSAEPKPAALAPRSQPLAAAAPRTEDERTAEKKKESGAAAGAENPALEAAPLPRAFVEALAANPVTAETVAPAAVAAPPSAPPSALDLPGLQMGIESNHAHMRLELEGAPLSVHMRITDGVADVRMSGDAAAGFGSRASDELRLSLVGAGLTLGSLEMGSQGQQQRQDRPGARDVEEGFTAFPDRRRVNTVTGTEPEVPRDGRHIHVKA